MADSYEEAVDLVADWLARDESTPAPFTPAPYRVMCVSWEDAMFLQHLLKNRFPKTKTCAIRQYDSKSFKCFVEVYRA